MRFRRIDFIPASRGAGYTGLYTPAVPVPVSIIKSAATEAAAAAADDDDAALSYDQRSLWVGPPVGPFGPGI